MSCLFERVLDTCNAVTGWTALGNDTLNLAVSNARVRGTKSLTFDKVDGAANKTYAGIYKTVASANLEDNVDPFNEVCWYCYLSDLTNVAYAYLKLGTDATNYVEYRYDDSLLTAGIFNFCHVRLHAFSASALAGCPFSDVDYMEIGVEFDAEANALAGIIVDHISIVPSGLVISV